MAYDTKTLKVLHELTEFGKKNYQDFLEREADDILFRHHHPLKWIVSKATEFMNG